MPNQQYRQGDLCERRSDVDHHDLYAPFTMNRNHSKSDRPVALRRGAALVEFVMVAPFFLLIIGATVELCSLTFVRESLAIAAYEGGRLAVRRTGTLENTDAKVREILQQRGVDLTAEPNPITITPDPATAGILTPITIRVRAPLKGNTVVPFSWLQVFNSNAIESQVVMRKEGSPLSQ